MKSSTATRAFVGLLVSAAFLWALTLSVSPGLHARIHSDANAVGHSCAVTLIASGNFNDGAAPALLTAPAVKFEIQSRPTLSPVWIRSQFLLACIFAHAPPARS